MFLIWLTDRLTVLLLLLLIEHYTVEFFFDDSIRSKNTSKH